MFMMKQVGDRKYFILGVEHIASQVYNIPVIQLELQSYPAPLQSVDLDMFLRRTLPLPS